MSDANSSLLAIGATSIKAALFLLPLSAMSDTYSSFHGSIGTSIKAASLHLCAMRNAYSSLSG
jgi:hypothetical protein